MLLLSLNGNPSWRFQNTRFSAMVILQGDMRLHDLKKIIGTALFF